VREISITTRTTRDREKTYTRATADEQADGRVVALRGLAEEVLEVDVLDDHEGREFLAAGGVLLAVAWEGLSDANCFLRISQKRTWVLTLVDGDGTVVVDDLESVVGDVADTAGTTTAAETGLEVGLGAGPDLDAGRVDGVAHGGVVDVDVFDNVKVLGVLAEGADRDTMGAVADQVLDDNIGAVGLERDTVVIVVKNRVLDDDVIGAVSVPAVQVLRLVVRGRAGEDIDVGDENVGGVGDEIMPVRGVAELQSGDGAAMEAFSDQHNGPLKGLVELESIIPGLTVAVEGADASTVDVDVLATKPPPGSLVLELVLEGGIDPEVNVVAETDGAGEGDIDVLQESQVKGLADGVLLVEDDGATVVAVLEGLQDLLGVITALGAAGLDEAGLGARLRDRKGLVGLEWTGLDVRARVEVAALIILASVGEVDERGGGEAEEDASRDHCERLP